MKNTYSSPRRPRKRLLIRDKSAVYHVMSRTVRSEHLFRPHEKEVFRNMLRKQAAFSGLEILTFCLMNSHFHLLLRVPAVDSLSDEELLERHAAYYGGPEDAPPAHGPSTTELETILAEGGREAEEARGRLLDRMGSLPAFMRELKQRFSIWFNHQHDSHGTIWSARYKSLLVEDSPEVVTKVAAYIDLNPVRAGIAEDPGNYRWCGYAEALAGVEASQTGLANLYGPGMRSFPEAFQSYRLILFGKGEGSKGTGEKDVGRIPFEKLAEVRRRGGVPSLQESLRARVRYFSDGMVLGSESFVEQQFDEHRELFGERRKRGGKKLPDSCWGGLAAMRDLQKNVHT